MSGASASSRSGKNAPQEAAVLFVAFKHLPAGGDRAFNLNPAAVADVFHRLAHLAEVDLSLAEQRAVFLGVKFADAFPKLPDFLVDVVAPVV